MGRWLGLTDHLFGGLFLEQIEALHGGRQARASSDKGLLLCCICVISLVRDESTRPKVTSVARDDPAQLHAVRARNWAAISLLSWRYKNT